MIKCLSCVKFDAAGLGLYCRRCFEARHPWYRAEHTYLPLAKAAQAGEDRAAVTHWVEADRQVEEMTNLLRQTQGWLDQLDRDAQDFRGDEGLKKSGKKLVAAEARLRAALEQLRGPGARGLDAAARALPGELEKLGREVQAATVAAAARGPSIKEAPRRSRRQVRGTVNGVVGKEEAAAVVIQAQFRRTLALRRALDLVREVYCRKLDPSLGVMYYSNTHTHTNSWRRPPLITRHREHILLTPRSHRRHYAERRKSTLALVPYDPCQAAASRLQGVARIWKAKKRTRLKMRKHFVKVFDQDQGAYYYFNRQTNEATWVKPKLLGGEDLDVFDPDTGAVVSTALALAPGHNADRAPLDEHKAARLIQGLFRRIAARREVVKLAGLLYQKVFDDGSQAYFYFNTRTGKSSWEKPLLLGGYDLDPAGDEG